MTMQDPTPTSPPGLMYQTVVFLRGKLATQRAHKKYWKRIALRQREMIKAAGGTELDLRRQITNQRDQMARWRDQVESMTTELRLARNAVHRDNARRQRGRDVAAVNEANRQRMVAAEKALEMIIKHAERNNDVPKLALHAIAFYARDQLDKAHQTPVKAGADAGLIGDHAARACRCSAVPLKADETTQAVLDALNLIGFDPEGNEVLVGDRGMQYADGRAYTGYVLPDQNGHFHREGEYWPETCPGCKTLTEKPEATDANPDQEPTQ